MSEEIKILSVEDLKTKRDSNEDFLLLDVRGNDEHEFCNIGGTLIPLQQIEERFVEIENYKEKEVVVYCRSGQRSMQAASFLKEQGFKNLANLEGGILAWADRIDPNIPKY